jgi:hypothetical protein
MTKDQSRKRVKKLFSEIEQLASEPNGDGAQDWPVASMPSDEGIQLTTPASLLQEVEVLRSRVCELEAQLKESEAHRTAAPMIYEKEEVGFSFSGDKVTSIRGGRQSIQNEADVVKTPLVSSGRTIGEFQVSQPPERPLTEDDIKLTNSIAQQASQQIENLRSSPTCRTNCARRSIPSSALRM